MGTRVGKSENSTVGVDVDTVGSTVVGRREGYVVVTLAVGLLEGFRVGTRVVGLLEGRTVGIDVVVAVLVGYSVGVCVVALTHMESD